MTCDRHPSEAETQALAMTVPSPRPNDDKQPTAVRLFVESGPWGWLLTVLSVGAIIGVGIVGLLALIRLLSQHV
ncbi:hypothetical protein AYO47_00080 [Planctomyces sp. SCGC AG-212-M04]|nr:hypothetical protein AYO47_00080 [Planctomyces sp. SCGC AG-212-M04]